MQFQQKRKYFDQEGKYQHFPLQKFVLVQTTTYKKNHRKQKLLAYTLASGFGDHIKPNFHFYVISLLRPPSTTPLYMSKLTTKGQFYHILNLN